MKSKILLRILVVAAAVLAPLGVTAQVNPEAEPAPQQAAPYKYEVYVGAAYTRIRQVPITYSGLIGEEAWLTRDWGRYFQLTGSMGYFSMGFGHNYLTNPGHPVVYSYLIAPGMHFPLYENLGGVLFAELGLEHTGNESMSPSTSFAGGFGGGLSYSFTRRIAFELTADRVGASFSLPNNTPVLSYSSNRTWDARATGGLVYRF